jgi:hypothetical protein
MSDIEGKATREGASKPGGERVSIKKDAAGKRSQATHEEIRVADYSPVFRVAENNRSSSTGQTGFAIWHIGRGELPGSVSCSQQG